MAPELNKGGRRRRETDRRRWEGLFEAGGVSFRSGRRATVMAGFERRIAPTFAHSGDDDHAFRRMATT